MEHIITQYHLRAICLFIPAISENFSVPPLAVSITLVTVSWSWSGWTQHHVKPGELN